SRRAGLCWVGAVADGLVVVEEAVEHRVGDADAGEAASVRALAAEAGATAEGAVHHVDRLIVVLAEHADGGAAEVRARRVADVVEEAAVHDLEPAAADEDGAAAP